MKKQLWIVTFVVIFFSTAFTSGNQLLPTSLQITVRNDLGNPVPEALVLLYATEDDYENGENAVTDSTYTNQKGQVRIKDLHPMSYFIDVSKDDLSNDGGGVQLNRLDKGKINKVTVIIQ